MQVFSLYFGRTIHGGGFVSDADWRGFRDDVLTAALPGGFTVLDAEGAWAAPDGRRTLAEPTKMLIVALPAVPSSWAAIAQVRQAYRTRFAQEAVGMTVQPGCASF